MSKSIFCIYSLFKGEYTMNKLKKTAKIAENVMNIIFFICGVAAVLFVLLITGFLVVNGTPAIKQIGLFDFLFGKTWKKLLLMIKYVL